MAVVDVAHHRRVVDLRENRRLPCRLLIRRRNLLRGVITRGGQDALPEDVQTICLLVGRWRLRRLRWKFEGFYRGKSIVWLVRNVMNWSYCTQ